MWVFSILLILFLAYFYIKKYDMDFYDALPLGLCSLLLMMYGLCFFGGLWWLDWIGCFVTVFFCLKLLFQKKKEVAADFFKTTVGNAKFVSVAFVVLAILLLTGSRAVSWWDDINFWAADAKFYYYYGGFAPKYGNVAPEFGDYPPLMSLVKWLFLHCNRNGFREGLMFAAYYAFQVILLLPLLAHGKRKHPAFHIFMTASLFMIPGIVDHTYVEGTCADVAMGILYGNFLWSVFRKDFHPVSVAVYGSALVLSKSVGTEWLLFGIIACLFLRRIRKKEGGALGVLPASGLSVTLGIPVLTEVSWLILCLLKRRVAKLTGAGVRMAVSGNLDFLKAASEKAAVFMKGFFCYPMHRSSGIGPDPSSAVFLLLMILGCLFLLKKRESKREGRLLLVYTAVTACAAYGIIFLGHLTIFAGETQYQDPAIMAVSTARYGIPFTMGSFFLLWNLFFETAERKEEQDGRRFGRYLLYLPFLITVLLFTDFSDVKTALFSGLDREAQLKIKEERMDMVEEKGQRYIKNAAIRPELTGRRVLYLRDDRTIHWVKDSYISYEVSPVATVYAGIDTESMTVSDIDEQIRASHACYLYCDRVDGDLEEFFRDRVNGGAFQPETFYRIYDTEEGIQLTETAEERKEKQKWNS